MKQFLSLIIFCCCYSSFGQQFLPLSGNKSQTQVTQYQVIDSLVSAAEKNKADTAFYAGLYRSVTIKQDTMIHRIIAAMNEEPDFVISGVGGVSNLETIGQAGGNFALCATFRLGKYRRIKNSQWADPAFLYMAFNTRTGSSADSTEITKSFLFPDISKRDFIIGAYFSLRHCKNNWNISPWIEFSLNRYKITAEDSTQATLRTESLLLGVRISKTQAFTIGRDSTYEAGFQLFPYYNVINVQSKNADPYYLAMRSSALPSRIHTLGLQAILQVSKLQLFANAKYILTNTRDLGIPDLTGLTYTIGTIVNVDILKFKISQ